MCCKRQKMVTVHLQSKRCHCLTLRGSYVVYTQQTRDIDLMLVQCWATVYDAGPTLDQHRVDDSCLLGTLRA